MKVKHILLTQGLKAIVDKGFFEELNQYNWYAQNGGSTFYACRTRYKIYMHREILRLAGIELGPHTDHIDGNGLNNVLSNLRPATVAQNIRNRKKSVNNTSGFKGVSFCRVTNKWCAYIHFCRKKYHLGLFNTPEEAASAYGKAATRFHREFSRPY